MEIDLTKLQDEKEAPRGFDPLPPAPVVPAAPELAAAASPLAAPGMQNHLKARRNAIVVNDKSPDQKPMSPEADAAKDFRAQAVAASPPKKELEPRQDLNMERRRAAQWSVMGDKDLRAAQDGTSSSDRDPKLKLSPEDARKDDDRLYRHKVLGDGRAIPTADGAEGRLGALQRDPRMGREEEDRTGAKIASKVLHSVPVLGAGTTIASGAKELHEASTASKIGAASQDPVTQSMASGLAAGHREDGVKDLVSGSIGMAVDVAGLATGGAAKLAHAGAGEIASYAAGRLANQFIGVNPVAPIQGLAEGGIPGMVDGLLGREKEAAEGGGEAVAEAVKPKGDAGLDAMATIVKGEGPIKEKLIDVGKEGAADAAGERAGATGGAGAGTRIGKLAGDKEGSRDLARLLGHEKSLASTGDMLAAGRELTGSDVTNASKVKKEHFWQKQQYNQIDKSQNLKPSMMAALSSGEAARQEQIDATGEENVEKLAAKKSWWQL